MPWTALQSNSIRKGPGIIFFKKLSAQPENQRPRLTSKEAQQQQVPSFVSPKKTLAGPIQSSPQSQAVTHVVKDLEVR